MRLDEAKMRLLDLQVEMERLENQSDRIVRDCPERRALAKEIRDLSRRKIKLEDLVAQLELTSEL